MLSWRLSDTLDSRFCVEALEEALARFGTPEIFNTDQGSQFTSVAFTEVLIDAGVRISMDGRGRWMDNVFIERLWRSLKHEDVYSRTTPTGARPRPASPRGLPSTTHGARTHGARIWHLATARRWRSGGLALPAHSTARLWT